MIFRRKVSNVRDSKPSEPSWVIYTQRGHRLGVISARTALDAEDWWWRMNRTQGIPANDHGPVIAEEPGGLHDQWATEEYERILRDRNDE